MLWPGFLTSKREAHIMRQTLARSTIKTWCASEARDGRERNRIQDITVGMVGNKAEALSTHGGESNDFLDFCVEHLLGSVRDLPSRGSFVRCGAAVCKMLELFRLGGKMWGDPAGPGPTGMALGLGDQYLMAPPAHDSFVSEDPISIAHRTT